MRSLNWIGISCAFFYFAGVSVGEQRSRDPDLKGEANVDLKYIDEGNDGKTLIIRSIQPPRRTYFAKVGDVIGKRFEVLLFGKDKLGISIAVLKDKKDDRILFLTKGEARKIRPGIDLGW